MSWEAAPLPPPAEIYQGAVVWAPLEDGQYRLAIVETETAKDAEGYNYTTLRFLQPGMTQNEVVDARYVDSLLTFDVNADIDTHPLAASLEGDALQTYHDTVAYIKSMTGVGEAADDGADGEGEDPEVRRQRKEAKRREKERKAEEKAAAKIAAREASKSQRAAARASRHDVGDAQDDDDDLFERQPVPRHDTIAARREISSAIGNARADAFIAEVYNRILNKKAAIQANWKEGIDLDKAFIGSERDILDRAKELVVRRLNVIPDIEKAAKDHSRTPEERRYAERVLQGYQEFALDDPDFAELFTLIEASVRRTPFAPRETTGQPAAAPAHERETHRGADPLLRVNMFASSRSLEDMPPAGPTMGRNDVSFATYGGSSLLNQSLVSTRPLMAGWRDARRKARGDERRVTDLERMRSSFLNPTQGTISYPELRGVTHISLANFAATQRAAGVSFAPSAIPSAGAVPGASARASAKQPSAVLSVRESAAPQSILPLASDPFATHSGNTAVLTGAPPVDPFNTDSSVSRGSSTNAVTAAIDASIIEWRRNAATHLKKVMTPYFHNKTVRTQREFAQLGKKLLARLVERHLELHGGSAFARIELPAFSPADAKSITAAVTDYLRDYRARVDAQTLKSRTIQTAIAMGATTAAGTAMGGMSIQDALAASAQRSAAGASATQSLASSRQGKRTRPVRYDDRYSSASYSSDYSSGTSTSGSSSSGSRSSSSGSDTDSSSSGSRSSSSSSASSASSSASSVDDRRRKDEPRKR